MTESIRNTELESQKRRSTRIVQAVPLTVTGVDALGRPFQERTSTFIIHCHGCRYQSKHYVLKNMWVTLEVPHPEAGRPPRGVRGRVVWIQRPRTVRELFQIGVELEVPGNIWGIAFPPSDWFPFPESASLPEGFALADSSEATPAEPLDWITSQPAASAASEAVESEDNLRVLPMPGGADVSVQMARQMTRLVVEAKQQVQTAARDAASRAVTAETRPLLAALESQLKSSAEKSIEAAVTAHMEQMRREASEHLESERRQGVAALQVELAREMDLRLAEARAQIDSKLGEVESTRRADFEEQIRNQIQGAMEKLRGLSGNLDSNAQQVQETIEQLRQNSAQAAADETRRWQEMMDERAAEIRQRLAHLEQATKQLSEQIAAGTSAAEAEWRTSLETDLAAARERWQAQISSSVDDAVRESAERGRRNAEASGKALEEQLHQRISAIGGLFSEATTEAQNSLRGLRASIEQETARSQALISHLHESASHLESRRGEFSALVESASKALANRSEALLEAQNHEMRRRQESAVAGMAERLRPVLEAAGQETIARLVGQLEQQLAPHVARASEITDKLAAEQNQAQTILVEHQRQLWQASERSVQDSVQRAKEVLAETEKEFSESARQNTGKWLAELEAKATETTHTTFEALFKSADWYEKKVQSQMQSTLEKGLDHASTSLREKAGEMSGLFASELDHYSRSYVEHAQDQMDEHGRDAAEQAKQQMEQAGQLAASQFTERAEGLARERFEHLTGMAESAFEKHAGRITEHHAQVLSKLEGDTRSLAGEAQRTLEQQAGKILAEGREELASQVGAAKDSLRVEAQSLEQQWQSSMRSAGTQALEEYRKRLENASNTWLLTTVSKLDQQSQTLIDQLAESTEARLRTICGVVVAEMGETLRQRLAGLFGSAAGPAHPEASRAAARPDHIPAPPK